MIAPEQKREVDFRKHPDNNLTQPLIVNELKTCGMKDLQSISLNLLRLKHETLQDGANAAEVFINTIPRPQIILLELAWATDESLNEIQKYIRGEVTKTPHYPFLAMGVDRNDFLKGFTQRLRDESVKDENFRPIVVCSEMQEKEFGAFRMEQAQKGMSNCWSIILDKFLEKDYEYYLQKYIESCAELDSAMAERDLLVADRFVNRLIQNPTFNEIKNVEQLRVFAPYGADHGRLSVLFGEIGLDVSSNATHLLNKPSEKYNLFLKYSRHSPDLVITKQVAAESLFAGIVEAFLQTNDEYQNFDEAKQNIIAWKMLNKLIPTEKSKKDRATTKYESVEAAFMDFRKQQTKIVREDNYSNFSDMLEIAYNEVKAEIKS